MLRSLVGSEMCIRDSHWNNTSAVQNSGRGRSSVVSYIASPSVPYLITGRINAACNAIASVRLFVRLFPLYLPKRVTVDLNVSRPNHSLQVIEGQGHRLRSGSWVRLMWSAQPRWHADCFLPRELCSVPCYAICHNPVSVCLLQVKDLLKWLHVG